MAKRQTGESQKKTGDVMESLIDRTGRTPEERPASKSPGDDQHGLERDPQDAEPKDTDSDDE